MKILRKVRKSINFRIIPVFILLTVSTLIAFPSIDIEVSDRQIKFDGLDLSDLSTNKFEYEAKFNPTLDFYGGSQVTYVHNNIDGAQPSLSTAKSTSRDLAARLNNLGIDDYDIYLRGNNESLQTVVQLPLTEEQLLNFNRILAAGNNVSFAIAVQQDQAEGSVPLENQQPTFQKIAITKNDIQSIALNYGSETRGAGLALKFKEDSWPVALGSSWSDFNNNVESRIFMQLGEEVVAAQVVATNSGDSSRTMFMTTGLGDDRLANALIRDVAVNSNLTTNLQVQDIVTVKGRYQDYLDVIKVGAGLLLILVCAGLFFLKRKKAIPVVLSFVTVAMFALALFKLLNFPIAISGILAFILALAFWLFGCWELSNLGENYVLEMKNKSSKQRNFVLVSTALLIALEYSKIQAIHIFAIYFAVTNLIAWFGLVYIFPALMTIIYRKK